MKKIKLFATLGAFALLLTTAFSNTTCYMYATGQKSGIIKGGVTQRGKEDSVEVYQVSHEIISPRDAASGLPTGKRMHKPFTARVRLDKASPLFYNMLATNENLSNVTFKFFQTSPSSVGAIGGAESQDFTVALTNANISEIRLVSIDTSNAEGKTNGMGIPMLEISFTYQKITWTSPTGGTTSGDNWETGI